MRHMDLFSGLAGFSLGLTAAGTARTVVFSEVDDHCCAVLAQRYPTTPNFGDVSTLRFDEHIDVITGGFPCQDISISGKGTGIGGSKSSLWFSMLEQVRRHTPRWIIIENSPALRTRGLDVVLSGLSALGYYAEWHCIPCTAVGAPHSRDRIWIISYPASVGDRLPEGQVLSRRHFLEHFSRWPSEPSFPRVVDGVPQQKQRLKALGNAVCPRLVYVIGQAINEVEGMFKCS